MDRLAPLVSTGMAFAPNLRRRDPAADSVAEIRRPPRPSLSVVVPATDRPATLEVCLQALRPLLAQGDELIVVTGALAPGPAAARNHGAERALGDVLVFIDSDVVIHPEALERLRDAFAGDPGLSAVFGSYDDRPAAAGAVSQFRNLLHHHVHQRHAGPAHTFWSGLGAVRRSDFLALNGFDPQRFDEPAVEDIDLGMRLRARGGRIDLRPDVQGKHLKRWTLGSMVRTDFARRGVPWVAMCLERRTLPWTLNLSVVEQASTGALVLASVSALTGRRRLAWFSLLPLGALNAGFYRLLYRRTGLRGACLGVALHGLHRAVAVAALPAGVAAHVIRRRSAPPAAGDEHRT